MFLTYVYINFVEHKDEYYGVKTIRSPEGVAGNATKFTKFPSKTHQFKKKNWLVTYIYISAWWFNLLFRQYLTN